jgi:DNA replication protein DnaC
VRKIFEIVSRFGKANFFLYIRHILLLSVLSCNYFSVYFACIFFIHTRFSQWNEVFADVTIASAILDRVLHHCAVINIKGESYHLKECKEFMRQKQQIVNTLFDQGNI